ncbi:hypothetical protein J4434_03050 [Candidatus Woesearchaeota archaeon]|nr:hypothetical protein [Candidatus Woesearchaeota archaeon]
MVKITNRISVGSMGREKETGTKGVHYFDYNASGEKEREELAFVSLEKKTPLSIKCVTQDTDIVFTNDGLTSIVLSDGSQEQFIVCPISKLKEAVEEVQKKTPSKDLTKILKSIEYGIQKSDFDGKVVGFRDGDVYLLLTRQREINLPNGRTLYDYPSVGLFYLHFKKGDFSKLESITYMPEWKPSVIQMVKTAEEYNHLFLAIECIIKSLKLKEANIANEPNNIEDYILKEYDAEQRYRIIDFDVLTGDKTYVSAIIEDKKTELCSVHIMDYCKKQVVYSPEKWIGRNSIRPLCTKLYKPRGEDKLFCFVGCYEGDLIVLESDISDNKLSEPEVKATHSFLSREEIENIEDIEEKRSAIKQIFVTSNDNLLFSLANIVMRVEIGELLKKPINCYEKKEIRMGFEHFETIRMIAAFDYYQI